MVISILVVIFSVVVPVFNGYYINKNFFISYLISFLLFIILNLGMYLINHITSKIEINRVKDNFIYYLLIVTIKSESKGLRKTSLTGNSLAHRVGGQALGRQA